MLPRPGARTRARRLPGPTGPKRGAPVGLRLLRYVGFTKEFFNNSFLLGAAPGRPKSELLEHGVVVRVRGHDARAELLARLLFVAHFVHMTSQVDVHLLPRAVARYRALEAEAAAGDGVCGDGGDDDARARPPSAP